MLPTRTQTIHFLNQELRSRARFRGLEVLPQQATSNAAEAAKIKLQNARSN